MNARLAIMIWLHPVAIRFQRLPQPLRAALWMVLACFIFSILNAFIRQSASYMHPFEVAFFRNLFGLVFMLPWLLRVGLSGLHTARVKLYFWRTLVGLCSMLTWFFALSLLPFAQAIALSFAAPLFATVLAATMLGETVRMRRWTATAIGFVGVLIIVRPGTAEFGVGAVLALVSAALMSISTIFVKQLSRTEPINAVVTYMVLLMTPMSLVTAVPVWDWPAWSLWPWLVTMGAVGSAGHFCFTRSLQLADASAVIPYDYTRLLFVAGIGWIAFGEFPDQWTWIGAAIIAAATIYITRREAYLARRAVSAAHATQAVALAADATLAPPPGPARPDNPARP